MTAILFTAFDRPDLLERSLASWDKVRHLRDPFWYFSIAPSPVEDEVKRIIYRFISRNEINVATVHLNPRRLGVLHHPWVGFENLFNRGENFVIRAEDDLCVSDDILEYFAWAELTYRGVSDVATIHGYQQDEHHSPNAVEVLPRFNPLIWGTWRHWWLHLFRDTWDHDYSTFNGHPGNQAGWDWNINTRLFPKHDLKGVYPRMSRVDNIGVHGTHSTPENYSTAPAFQPAYGVVDYHES